MKKLSLIIFAFSVPFILYSQEIKSNVFRIGITGGYSLYLQDDLVKINNDVKDNLEFETNLIDDFPPNSFMGGYFLVNFAPTVAFGVNYQYHSTGSRLGTKDFSGFYRFDQIISCHSVAFQFERVIYSLNNFSICTDPMVGVNFSTWEIIEEINIGGFSEKSTTTLIAKRPFIYPSLKLRYKVLSIFNISTSLGYAFEIGGKYKLKNSKTESDKKASWNGPRANLSLEYCF